MVRSKQEWAEHPQGQAVAGMPLVTITRIGASPPEPLPDGDRPAAGVRVIDLTRVLAGPTCAKTIAEHGADVLAAALDSLVHARTITAGSVGAPDRRRSATGPPIGSAPRVSSQARASSSGASHGGRPRGRRLVL